MANLTPLDLVQHKDLKVSAQRSLEFARNRHMLPLNVAEVNRAIVDFPVLISRVQSGGGYALSALMSFEPQRNLFLDENGWQSSFQPSEMVTFPFVLMAPEDGATKPVIGLDETQSVFSKQSGDPLLDVAGQPSLWLNKLENQLIENAKNASLTNAFFDTLVELGLISSIVITVHYVDGRNNKIGGLSTINEDKLKSLGAQELSSLNDKGFLGPMYAVLFSIYQLNSLIRRNNEGGSSAKIERISLEMEKHQ